MLADRGRGTGIGAVSCWPRRMLLLLLVLVLLGLLLLMATFFIARCCTQVWSTSASI